MKIVHITPSLAGGGAERMLSKLVEYDETNEHIIISLLNLKPHYKITNAEVIYLDLENNKINKLKAFFILKRCIKKIDPDLIQTWMKANFYGPLLKMTNQKKIVSNFRNGYSGTRNKVFLKLYTRYFNFFDGHIFVSKSALKEREDVGIRFSKCRVITNGFVIPKSQRKAPRNQFTIGHLSRYHSIKNQQMLINAYREFSKGKDTNLVLAGRDLNEKNLDISKIDHKKITILGELTATSNFYNSIDLFVLTSKSEGFPNVIGEAMSYGVPVITTNAGESFQIIGKTGYKVSSEQELVKILNELFLNDANLIEKGLQAKNRIKEKYSIHKIINNYTEFYNEIGE
ncbi:glycosyltransferase [Salinicoccus sesuvii]|uniref:Glycosyltransferase n=1 Tax=Salinicoccus sesuvii TaxID=868281 RepID=A0ABV7N762_9STAP